MSGESSASSGRSGATAVNAQRSDGESSAPAQRPGPDDAYTSPPHEPPPHDTGAGSPVGRHAHIPEGDPTGSVASGPHGADVDQSGGFTPAQLSRIDEALTLASRETGLTFSLYVGALDEPTRRSAEALFDRLDGTVEGPVLVAVSPGQRVLHIVTGEASATRLPNRACALAALAMRASFSSGDLVGGIITGLRMLADAAGRHR